ncbi:unnamed protein product [marine sediment metagenome]|uniref:Uncharacterized protein n=1 Tax=marine sediment metagenome TaxID=412755 RepID=X1N7P6_9ZZZZ
MSLAKIMTLLVLVVSIVALMFALITARAQMLIVVVFLALTAMLRMVVLVLLTMITIVREPLANIILLPMIPGVFLALPIILTLAMEMMFTGMIPVTGEKK